MTNSNNRVSPFIVGVSGHRDLHPECLPRLREATQGILRQLLQRLPESEVRLMAGMATGADLLVAQVALEMGIGVDAMLPMPLVQYASDFDQDSFAQLKTILSNPGVRFIELPLGTREEQAAAAAGLSMRDAHYAGLTRTLIRGCSLLITLWDGEPSLLPGGTADTVLRYLDVRTDRNKDDQVLRFFDAAPDQDLPDRLAYWIPARRARTGRTPVGGEACFLAGLSDNALVRLPQLPHRLDVHLRSLNAYNKEYRRFANSWRWPGPPDSLVAGLSAQTSIDPRDRNTIERIDSQYGKADGLAIYFQKRSDQLFTFFNLVAFVMGFAYLVYEKFLPTRTMLLTYVLILGSSALLYLVLHERHWFAKHLMCRALAETLRVKFYLRLAGCDQNVNAHEVLSLSGINRFHGFGWIGHVLVGLEWPRIELEAAAGTNAPENGVDQTWIENQRRYFVRKVAQLHLSGERTKWAKRFLFGTILLVCAILLVLGKAGEERELLGASVQTILTFGVGLMAVTLGSWELHQNKMATRELLWQYRNQLKHYSRASAQLALTGAAGRRLEILAELGRDSLMESYLWTIHRFHREHEPPGGTGT
ncbi:MAG: hypothetical protein JSR67_06915 [Proteobacteria bacterium]|nr:hypothetical protein [Pseudomonadota bacterium]